MSANQIDATCQRRRKLRPAQIKAALLALAAVAFELCSPASAFFIDSKQSPKISEWSYAVQEAWGRQHRDCLGRAQSPIDIQHKNVIISNHLKLHFYNYDQQLKFKLSNAHHTIKMNPTGGAYDQPELLEGRRGDGPNSNDSSIHDIITADEYVEFPTDTSNQQQQATQAQHEASASRSRVNKERLVGLPDEAAPPRLGGRLPSGQGDSRHAFSSGSKRLQHNSHTLNNNNNNIEHEQALGGKTSDEPYEGAPAIKLDWLDDGNNEFKLRDIHFHWAERRDNGSEHAIDGRRAAMEMHLVHIKHGLDKSKIGFTSDSVTVIAILIESHRKSNADFNPIVNELARINGTEEAQPIEYKSIYDLLPSNLDAFYTYSGSLTTPPCYQVVNWIVMAERLNMNAKQIEMFRNLYAPSHDHDGDDEDKQDNNNRDHGPPQSFQTLSETGGSGTHDEAKDLTRFETLIMPNVRHLQALNNRTILASFTKYGSRLKSAYNQANSIHGQLFGGVVSTSSVVVSLLVAIIQLISGNNVSVGRLMARRS